MPALPSLAVLATIHFMAPVATPAYSQDQLNLILSLPSNVSLSQVAETAGKPKIEFSAKSTTGACRPERLASADSGVGESRFEVPVKEQEIFSAAKTEFRLATGAVRDAYSVRFTSPYVIQATAFTNQFQLIDSVPFVDGDLPCDALWIAPVSSPQSQDEIVASLSRQFGNPSKAWTVRDRNGKETPAADWTVNGKYVHYDMSSGLVVQFKKG